MHRTASHLAACISSRAGPARSLVQPNCLAECSWSPTTGGNGAGAPMPGHQTCRNTSRTKETLLATVGLAGACAGTSTEVTFWLCDSHSSQFRLVRELAQIPSAQLEL